MPAGKPTITPEQKAKARAMYFEHYSEAQISQAMNLKEATVRNWIHGGKHTDVDKTWRWQREKRERELAETLVVDNSYHIRKLYRVSLPLIVDTVTIRAKKAATKDKDGKFPDALSMKEAKELTEIITSLDKLFRLDNGRPTDIFGVAPVSLEQLKAAISKDAFIDVSPDGGTKPNEKDEEFDEQLRKALDGSVQPRPKMREVPLLGPTATLQGRPERDVTPDGPPENWAGFGLSPDEQRARKVRHENARRNRTVGETGDSDSDAEEGDFET